MMVLDKCYLPSLHSKTCFHSCIAANNTEIAARVISTAELAKVFTCLDLDARVIAANQSYKFTALCPFAWLSLGSKDQRSTEVTQFLIFISLHAIDNQSGPFSMLA